MLNRAVVVPSRHHSFNNSDDEDAKESADGKDFISFPTIPDPEQENAKTLSRIFTKTLRKVTVNASNLVQNYSYTSPRANHTFGNGNLEIQDETEHHIDKYTSNNGSSNHVNHNLNGSKSQDDRKDIALDTSHYQQPATGSSDITSKLIEASKSDFSIPPSVAQSPILESRVATPHDDKITGTSESEAMISANTSGADISHISNVDKKKSAADKLDSNRIVSDDAVIARPQSVALGIAQQGRQPIGVDDFNVPKVTSDKKSLRISTMQFPLQSNSSAASSTVNINSFTSERDKLTSDNDDSISNTNSGKTAKVPQKKDKALQRKISSIFNNLPNDIELSDDSASDSETINESYSSTSHSNNAEINNRSDFQSNATHHPSYYDFSLYSESVAKSSPIKAELHRGYGTSVSTTGSSPTLNTIYALKNKDHGMKKKPSSNLSTVLIDNARSMFNNNISGVVSSSASSIVTSRSKERRKKKKPHRPSENPLKNGGIPKKYWMNDSFVSDCLNCFKPFTAFRRKHHCRFCGQIFCSDCTLFISYNQHKEERKNRENKGDKSNRGKKPYNDKLRVCRPCYSDVIVYLSDDSSSSSSDSEGEQEEAVVDSDEESEQKLYKEDALMPQHPLSRIRSLSTNSRRDSLMNESTIAANRGFLNKNVIAESPTREGSDLSPSKVEDSIKVHQKQAPQMAIPTTRTGESVEIPVPKSSYNNSTLLGGRPSKYNLDSLIMGPSSLNTPHRHHGQTANSASETISLHNNSSGRNWLKNYSHLRNANVSTPDLQRSNSMDSISNMYNNLIGRKSSQGRLRLKSNSEKDLQRKASHRSEILNNSTETDIEYDEEEDDDYDDHRKGNESEDEDEQAMSLYASLNHNGLNNTPSALASKPVLPSSSLVVPTLGEFPTMSNFHRTIGGSSRFLNSSSPTFNHAITFLEELPKSHNIRSLGRAHASLERIRSRRKSKSVRNISSRTRDNIRLPSVETHVGNLPPSPISSPSSPTPNSIGQQSNLSRSFVKASINLTTENDSDLSPIAPRISNTMERDISQDLYNSDHERIDTSSILPELAVLSLSPSENVKQQEDIYNDLFDTILKQCLEDCDIKENQQRWIDVLKKVLRSIDNIKLTDTLDIRQYLKIKKVYGGSIEETKVIDGLFMTKNIDSKRMSSSLKNPKIALLMFPLEYLKQKEQFISLRIIHSQQAVYITNLVSRLVTLGPDIIVVGDSVCGLAETLLEEAGITVISNTKPQVIERISRYTKADIFQSVNDLFFKKGSLGSCARFEIKKYLFQNMVKTFAFFTGNDISSGFTISLRGGDEDLLNSIKYAAETLMPGYLNARFERGLLENQMTIIDESKENTTVMEYNKVLQEIKNDETEIDKEEESKSCEFSLDSTEVVDYVNLFNKRKLSLSPASTFSLPTPLVNVIESYYQFHLFYKKNKMIQLMESPETIKTEWLEEMKVNFDPNLLPNKGDDSLKFLKLASEQHLKSLISDYHSRARVWSNCMTYTSYQLYPVFHKKIYVLHSTVSIKHATPCSGPSIVVIDYYTENDKCLGLVLDQIFHESSKDCDECGESFLNHYKTYAHGNAKLDLILEKFEDLIPNHQNYQGKNQRVMWSYCKECHYTTPIVAMTDETYYLSIGKFLELSFYGGKIMLNDPHACSHDYATSHIRCFGFNDFVIRVEYSKIDNYDVVVPKKQLEFMPEVDIKLKLDSLSSIQAKTEQFFQSISKRLNRVKVDTFDRAADGVQKINELKNKLDDQLNGFKAKTMEIFNSTHPTNHLCLNSILRDLQELGVEWDGEFYEFEREFLPSENEITRITQFHLRNFLDKYNEGGPVNRDKQKEKDEVPTLVVKDDENIKQEVEKDQPGIGRNSGVSTPVIPEVSYSENEIADESLEDHAKDITPALQGKISNVRDKISKFEGPTIETEGLKKGVTTPIRTLSHRGSEASLTGIQSQSKVSHLASFFDSMSLAQISKEFQIQREKELQEKSNKFRAIPIVDSKPIVEIYENIEDVVNDDDRKRSNLKKEATKELDRGIITDPADSVDDSKQKVEKAIDGPSLSRMNKVGTKSIEISQPEKVSLLKSLTKFWADRSATLWDPLEYPLDSHEHTFVDSEVIVRDDEPSSLVAFCLSSNDYKQKIKAMELETLTSDSVGGFDLESNEINKKKINNFSKIEKKFKKNFNDTAGTVNQLERIMIKNKSNHLKYQFVDGNINLSCKIFYSEQFEAFRNACGNHENFIQSLSRCVKWKSSGGKSGSSFLKTLDDRYIVKELSTSELDSFVSIAPFYFKYISQSMFNTLTTAIAKIFGFYQIQVKNTVTGKTIKMDFLIMENLFYNHKTTRIFDLKGSMRNRHVKQTGKENEVLLDENMIEYIYESPVFVKEQSKKLLRGSLFNDTSFLSAMEVMDYSLVIGIDDSTKKLYIGIIDWLRAFTWDKKVENWVKGNNLIGGNKKGKDPTIVTPKQYRTRFREAMERYILEVPDIWYEGTR